MSDQISVDEEERRSFPTIVLRRTTHCFQFHELHVRQGTFLELIPCRILFIFQSDLQLVQDHANTDVKEGV